MEIGHMSRPGTLLALFVLAGSAHAGDLKGTVTAKGGGPAADAVVYIDKIAGKTFPAPTDHGKVDQLNMKFVPKVLPVLTGATVDFVNSDPVSHNVFTPEACADKFNLGTWGKGLTKSHVFSKDCAATLLCLVHPEMEGFVVAVPTPYFAKTGADGTYTIGNVPDGSYTVKVWHPKLKGASKPATLPATGNLDFELVK
jgi:plastocyanin